MRRVSKRDAALIRKMFRPAKTKKLKPMGVLNRPVGSGSVVGGLQTTGWPHVSQAMGVHPKQVAETNALYARHGIKARHRANGDLISPDQASRKQAMRFRGMYDKDAFS